MSTGDMRNVSIGMDEPVEELIPSASVPGGRNVTGGGLRGGGDTEGPLAVAGRSVAGAVRKLSFPQ